MKPLYVLIIAFFVTLFARKKSAGQFDFHHAGRVSMSIMLVFTAVGHFAFPAGMAMMLPEVIPFKSEIIFLTGLLEFAAAFTLFIPSKRIAVGWLLIAFFIMVLPANIYAALRQVDYQSASFNGPGINYLWVRIPLQILFIAWVYFFVVYPARILKVNGSERRRKKIVI